MSENLLVIISMLFALLFLITLARAMMFSPRQKARRALLVFGGLFFATGGIIQMLAPPITPG